MANPHHTQNGLSGHKTNTRSTYKTWEAMVRRCHVPSTAHFEHYGGRGIKVTDEWRQSFVSFLRDMGTKPPGSWIDRIDNNDDYKPGNCRWATHAEQQRNRRNNIQMSFNGETRCLAEWARLIGIKEDTLRMRVKRGWSYDKALTKPIRSAPTEAKHRSRGSAAG